MYSSYSTTIEQPKSLQDLFKYLSMNMRKDEIQEKFNLKKEDLTSIIKYNSIEFDKAINIAKTGGFALDQMNKDGIDSKTVYLRLQDQALFPLQYMKIAYTRCRVALNIFKSIEDRFGPTFLDTLLRYLQVDRKFLLSNENDLISTNFNAKIYQTLRQYFNFSTDDIIKLGLYVHYSDKSKTFINAFKNLSVTASYAKLVEEIYSILETSHEYKILKLNKHKIILRKKLSQKLIEENNGRIYGAMETCLYSAGAAGSLYLLKTGKFPTVKINKNLYNGDKFSELEVNFN